jgi:hypothetical protein
MKTFLDFLSEENIPTYKLLRPAVKYPDGHVAKGARGKDHSEIRADNSHKYDTREGEAGFWHSKEKKFLSRKEAAAHAPRSGASGESTEMLTHDEREKRKNRQKRETGSRGSMSSADLVSDVVRAHRSSKYGTPSEYRFEEEAEIEEGNQLWSKVEKPLRQGEKLATITADRDNAKGKKRKAMRQKLQGDLERLRKKGAIGGYKKADGRYRYAEPRPGEEGINVEKSFVVRQGKGKQSHRFDKVMAALRKRHDQESIGKVEPGKSASLEYADKVDNMGKVMYDKKIGDKTPRGTISKVAQGDTILRGGRAFTFAEE